MVGVTCRAPQLWAAAQRQAAGMAATGDDGGEGAAEMEEEVPTVR